MQTKNFFLLFFVLFIILAPYTTYALELKNVFPKKGLTVYDTIPILAEIESSKEDIFWEVSDLNGALFASGEGDEICVVWNTRYFVGPVGDIIFFKVWTKGEHIVKKVKITIDNSVPKNPLIKQLSSSPVEGPTACGGTLERGSERVAPNKEGDLVAFLSNSFSEIETLFDPRMPICQNCELFIHHVDQDYWEQLTQNPASQGFWKAERVDTDDSGNKIVFTSSADLVGKNPKGAQQVYLYVRNIYDQKVSKIEQLTRLRKGEIAERCSISGDGSIVAFDSTTDILGTNPKHLRQLFVVDVETKKLRQLTFGEDGEVRAPVISGNGQYIAFASSFDLLGENPDHIYQIYIIKSSGKGLKQLTHFTERHCGRPSIDWEGKRIVFLAYSRFPDEGLIGLGGDIYSIHRDGSNLFTYTNVDNYTVQLRPTISGNGKVITWESTANLTGENSDHSREIFVCHFEKRDFKQITHTNFWDPRFLLMLVQRPYLNYDGSKVFFEGTMDITGENPNLWLQVFESPTGF